MEPRRLVQWQTEGPTEKKEGRYVSQRSGRWGGLALIPREVGGQFCVTCVCVYMRSFFSPSHISVYFSAWFVYASALSLWSLHAGRNLKWRVL